MIGLSNLTTVHNVHKVHNVHELRTITLLLLALSLLLMCNAAPAQSLYDKDTLHLFSTLPVLDDGRIKPLDTYAGFKLLKLNGRRSCTTPDGRRIKPIEWLLDCLFVPEKSEEYAVFSVDSSDVIVAIGLMPHEKKRDRYCYRELKAGQDRLFELAGLYSRTPGNERTLVQNQLVNLAQNVSEYEMLIEYAQFARQPFAVPPNTGVAALFPNATEVSLSDLLPKAPAIRERFLALKRDTNSPKEEVQAFSKILTQIDTVRSSSRALALFPPASPEEKEWLTPADIVSRAFDTDGAPDAELLRSFEALVQARKDVAQFKQQASTFCGQVKQRATDRGEYGKIALEVAFYKWQFFGRALEFFVLGFLLVALTWLLPRNKMLYGVAQLMIILPTVLLMIGIVMRCIIRDRPPVTTLYETILFTTAVAIVVALFMEYVNRQRIALAAGAIIAVIGMFLANKYEAREGVDTMQSMVAVLDTNFWLATHVTTISMGYAACFLSGVIGHVYILGRLLGFKKQDKDFYPSVARMVYGVFCFGFFFAFLGTLLGGIWANESWGRFWGWDPKENGALLIVLWQLATLHARRGGYIRDLGLCIAAVCCAMIVAFSWWGVNLLGVGLHSYGFTSGAMTWLIIFWVLEGIVVCLGMIQWARRPRA